MTDLLDIAVRSLAPALGDMRGSTHWLCAASEAVAAVAAFSYLLKRYAPLVRWLALRIKRRKILLDQLPIPTAHCARSCGGLPLSTESFCIDVQSLVWRLSLALQRSG